MGADAQWLGTMPAVYDEKLGPAMFAVFADDLAARAAGLRPARVLELAAGTGVLTRALAAALPGTPVVATDLNDAMVAYAAPRVPTAEWRQADAQSLDLPDASFDLVACQFGVMFFPDRPRAHAEAHRVLRAGGHLLFNVWDVAEASRFAAALIASLRTVLPQDPPEFVVRVPHGYADVDRIRADVVSAGFTVEGLERVVLSGSAPSAHALAEGLCLGTPLRFELQQRGDLAALTDAVAEQMRTRLGEGRVVGDLAAFVVTARRD